MNAEIFFGEGGIAAVPDRLGGVGRKQFLDAEVAAQFHVHPVVHGIAQGLRHGLGPGLEFLAWGRIASNEALGDAVGAEEPPFVVIAAEPEFGDILPAMVVGNFCWREVAVVVVDRCILGDLMVEAAGGVAVEKKVVVQVVHDRW